MHTCIHTHTHAHFNILNNSPQKGLSWSFKGSDVESTWLLPLNMCEHSQRGVIGRTSRAYVQYTVKISYTETKGTDSRNMAVREKHPEQTYKAQQLA